MRVRKTKEIVRKDVDWHDLSGNEIVRLLSAFPQLANKCDLRKLSVEDWVDLLHCRPEFKSSCKHLQKEIELEIDRRKKEEEWQRDRELERAKIEEARYDHVRRYR